MQFRFNVPDVKKKTPDRVVAPRETREDSPKPEGYPKAEVDKRDELLPGMETFSGSIARKPWDYHVTVCIPHRDSPELVQVIQPLYWYQTVKPYIMIIDTGSMWSNVEKLESLRTADTEIHYIRHHASLHASQPVSWALDLALSICRSQYLYFSHSDVFPMSRSLLEELMTLTSEDSPVVGYSMSNREDARRTSPYPINYKGVPGHACLMLHVPTIRDKYGLRYGFKMGEAIWTDTEIAFGEKLKELGIPFNSIGVELNYVRQTDSRIDHCRSTTALSMSSGLHGTKVDDLTSAVIEARKRAGIWERESSAYASLGFPW